MKPDFADYYVRRFLFVFFFMPQGQFSPDQKIVVQNCQKAA